MSLLQILSKRVLLKPSRMFYRSFANGELTEDYSSVQYSSDGERMECGLKFKPEGNMTEEEMASIIESARAKDFDDSRSRVVLMKIDP